MREGARRDGSLPAATTESTNGTINSAAAIAASAGTRENAAAATGVEIPTDAAINSAHCTSTHTASAARVRVGNPGAASAA